MTLTTTPEQDAGLAAMAKRDGFADATTYMQAQLNEHARVGMVLVTKTTDANILTVVKADPVLLAAVEAKVDALVSVKVDAPNSVKG